MFMTIAPVLEDDKIYGDSTWNSSDVPFSRAFRITKPSKPKPENIQGWFYHPLELPYWEGLELERILTLDSRELTKSILWKFDWGIEESILFTLIDDIYNHLESQPKNPNIHNFDNFIIQDSDSDVFLIHSADYHPSTTQHISLELLPRIFDAVIRKLAQRPEGNSGLSLNGAKFSKNNLGSHHTQLDTLSFDTVRRVDYILPGSTNGIQSVLLVPSKELINGDDATLQQYHIINALSGNPDMHPVLVDIPLKSVQAIIRAIHEIQERLFKSKYGIVSFDSTNIAHIIAQTVFPFRVYSELVKQGKIKNGDEINIWVSSGDYSEVLSYMYAKEMWLPIKYIHITVNDNDAIWDLLKTGKYISKNGYTTFSDYIGSQEITKLANLERILLLITDNNYEQVRRWFDDTFTAREEILLSQRTLKEIKETLIIWKSSGMNRPRGISSDIEKCRKRLSKWASWNIDKPIPLVRLDSSHTLENGIVSVGGNTCTSNWNNPDRVIVSKNLEMVLRLNHFPFPERIDRVKELVARVYWK